MLSAVSVSVEARAVFRTKCPERRSSLSAETGEMQATWGKLLLLLSCSAQRLPGARMDIFRERNRGRPYYNKGESRPAKQIREAHIEIDKKKGKGNPRGIKLIPHAVLRQSWPSRGDATMQRKEGGFAAQRRSAKSTTSWRRRRAGSVSLAPVPASASRVGCGQREGWSGSPS